MSERGAQVLLTVRLAHGAVPVGGASRNIGEDCPGNDEAIGATRHDILVIFYHIVRTRSPTVTWAPTGTNNAAAEHRTRRLVRQLEHLGHKVTREPAA